MKTTTVLFIVAILIFIMGTGIHQMPFKNNKTMLPFDKGDKYTEQWAKVDSLEKLRQPKSALKIVDEIYKDAKANNNSDQIIKAFIYKLKFTHAFEEDAFEKAIYDLQDELKATEFPSNAIMHAMLGDMYWMYYQANRWQINKRTQTVDFELKDIKAWDLTTILNEVIKNYRLSLENADSLKRTSIDVYDEIISDGSHPKELRPTLYDFIGHKAIAFFANTEAGITQPADKFELKEAFYFDKAKSFAEKKIETSDTLSLHFYAVQIYQELLKLRLEKKKETDALVDADLARLQFVYNNSVNEQKDSLYLNALQHLRDEYHESPVVAQVIHAQAIFYNNQSSKYNYENELTHIFKDDKKKAIELCNEAIKKYPKSYGAEMCKTLIDQIKVKSVSMNVEAFIPAQNTFSAMISWKNLKEVHYRIASIDREKLKKIQANNYGDKLFDKIKKESKTIKTSKVELPDEGDYLQHTSEILLEGLPLGTYIIMCATDDNFTYKENMVCYSVFNSTQLSYISQKQYSGAVDFYVTDRFTGKPAEKVNAQAYVEYYDYKAGKYKKKKHESFITGKDGYFRVNPIDQSYASLYVEFKKGVDFLSTESSMHINKYDHTPSQHNVTHFYLDRGIYRPGQTVHFKGVMLSVLGEKNELLKKQLTGVVLLDPNYQKVGELDLTTNEYGSISGSFTIPTGRLNGQWQIKNEYGSVYFSVEEYKRPKFEVKFNPLDGNYLLNDTVKVKVNAKALAGPSISDGQVKYRVVRKPVWRGWWYFYFDTPETEIANGTLTTNEKGEAEIAFKAVPDNSMAKSPYLSFNYRITADVTDINGETQSANSNVEVGYRALTVGVAIPGQLNKDNKNNKESAFRINTKNLNGVFIPAKGTIKIYKLKTPGKVLRERKWAKPDKPLYSKDDWYEKFPGNVYAKENAAEKQEKGKEVFSTEFNTKDKKMLVLKNLKKWSSGKYVVEISSKDAFNNPVDSKSFFTVFSHKDSKMPFATADWFTALTQSAEPGENAQFLIGSAYDEAKIVYQIEHKGEIVKQEWLTLKNEQKLIEVPVEEKHRGNFSVHFVMIYNNRMYQHTSTVVVPYTNKELDITFETFRNKLYPGQEDEWRIKIKGSKGEKVAAEMLATLYDASLDAFRKNHWWFNIYRSFGAQRSWGSNVFGTSGSNCHSEGFNHISYYTSKSYDSFNWFNFSFYNPYRQISYATGGVMRKSASMKRNKADKEVMMDGFGAVADEEEMDVDMVMSEAPAEMEKKEESKAPPAPKARAKKRNGGDDNGEGGEENGDGLDDVKARSNFSENAFFYPHLQTNEEGDVIIKFTIPEALTRWRMMGFAYTTDLKYGFTENELITQKDLMVMPNPPRFFRENDEMEFPVKISNLTEDKLGGKIRLQFFDALSMEEVKGIIEDNETKDFSVDAQLNSLVTWQLKIPEKTGALVYRVVAKSGNFSDGEENTLPVLTNRMLVTESLPLPVRSKQTKTFKFEKLVNSGKSKTLKHHKLTLEFTSNPAWYAVQALPYLMEYPYECNEQIFSRFYANSLASHVANSSPKIKRVFDSWKETTTATEGALLSNLEKNHELKALLLEETPWVLNGQNETERKKRIGLLFDLNKMGHELETALNKLIKAQTWSGGWPWFQGMPESRYITQHIVCGFGHLDHLKVNSVRENQKVWNMVKKAIGFIDKEIKKDYKELKKYYSAKELKEDHLSYTAIHYLYTRSYFTDIEIPKSTREAFDYYFGQAKQYWGNKGKYSEGMIALALNRYDENKTPALIVKSLKEHSLESDEMGMYWKDNVSGYFWYQAPIETQALMIEVFDEVAKDAKSVDALKVWLLKQKQTQDWKTTKATVEAVYALLLRGANWLDSDKLVDIKLGDMKIDPNAMDDVKVEAGTGYFKTSWSGGDIKPEMGNVTLTKHDDGIAWGALYWQYFEQLDKITTHETPLKLTKKLFIEKDTDRGKVIEPIKKKSQLKIGDKVIVRIELRVDREMEYVHMKDMRAAGFEPVNVISQYKYQDGLGYYESTKDAATNFFIGYLRKGTYVFEYPLRVSHNGDFSNGITTIQCMYAPEFTSHSEGIRVQVGEK